ncbi:hypothetical protein K491DRAFT_586091 [Lophiostoma macrostomum CBS 122681]|uniref:Heterokaryon incompatibility domain-containing protein n=1 Tax=Lophiostoma macrostomum CBS 122681 TaxID=1314788 RepID=A0A6A6TPH2_9PLEO|nr:hypothetical protein K491DRAFT_586091 [Lophiostoma macrostomum CBS 122681]
MRLRNILRHVPVSQNLRFLRGNYQYEPLPTPTSVRLLEITPSSERALVRCSLSTFELQSAPAFHCLSYTWGDPKVSKLSKAPGARNRVQESGSFTTGEGRRFIICNDQLMKVSSNLRDALRMLASSNARYRLPKTPRYYWIDAISMDQQNIPERNDQVARMADIFQSAQEVLVWLGKEDEYTRDGITTIERISSVSEEDWKSISYTSLYDHTATGLRERPNVSLYNWLGFIALINRPWFQRAWVVQEIALARSATVIIGDRIFDWTKLSRTLAFLKATRWYHHLHTGKLRHIPSLTRRPGIYKKLLQTNLDVGIAPVYLDATRLQMTAATETSSQEPRKGPPLRTLLDAHRFSKSTDPRDKVYAFLGLADKTLQPFRDQPGVLMPNYNLTVQQVYTEATRSLLTGYGSLTLLSHVQDPSLTKIPNLPSWVPDFSTKLDPYALRFRGPAFWRACGNAKWDINVFSMEHGELDVQGYKLDTIDQTSILLNENGEDPADFWASIVKLALALETPYPNPARKQKHPTRVEVLWRTLTTDTYDKKSPAPESTGDLFIDYILNLQIRHRLTPWSSNDEFQPHQSPVSESIYPEWDTLLRLEPPESSYSLTMYKNRLATVVESMFNGSYSPIGLAQLQHEFDVSGGKKRRLFKTPSNYMGTGPRSLRSGDEIWILHGGAVPFVLRRRPNENYQLIGEAFVYGMMNAEVQTMNLPRRHIIID